MKSGLGRISESTAKYQGVVVYNMADVPLVFMLDKLFDYVFSSQYILN